MEKTINHLNSLLDAIKKGYHPKYLFFWGHQQPRKDGQIGKQCFSQWWPAGFTVDEVYYRTAEHYMMAEKARLFDDEVACTKILQAPHPNQAKKLGRTVQGFETEIWEAHRYKIVVQGNIAKFTQNESLKTFLLNTHKRVLVEASPVDPIWGIGLTADDPKAMDPEQWEGLNLLGFALMDVRTQLQ
ncbi:MAG: NADAR family protein [Chloroflexota bacterium]